MALLTNSPIDTTTKFTGQEIRVIWLANDPICEVGYVRLKMLYLDLNVLHYKWSEKILKKKEQLGELRGIFHYQLCSTDTNNGRPQ